MMSINPNKIRMALAAVAMIALAATPSFAKFCGAIAAAPSNRTLSPLAGLRAACPVLGAIVEEFAMQDLGESAVAPRESRHLVESRPLLGDVGSIARLAREAQDAGATIRDFEEALYLTAVTAGAPQAIAATQTLLGVFAEQAQGCVDVPARVDALT
jgi:hypothetical protein